MVSLASAEIFVAQCAGAEALLGATAADGAAAVSLDAVLQVVLTYTGLMIARMHKAQQGKPSAQLPAEAPQSVPPYHDAFLEAAGLGTFRPSPPDIVRQLTSQHDIPAQCLPALDWALQYLCQRLQDEAAAANSKHAGCCSSSGAGNASSSTGRPAAAAGSSSAGSPVGAAGSSKVSTAPGLSPAGTPYAAGTANSCCDSGGGAASFHSMRLLPLLPALLSELVALQPRAAVLSSVLDINAKCLRIGDQLQQAGRAQQPSHPGSCTASLGLAIIQGLFRACLEVFVPVQQHLAAPYSSLEDLNASRGAAAALTDITWTGNDPKAGPDAPVTLYSGQARKLGVPLFQLLAASLAAFDQQHGETALWLPTGMCASAACSSLEAGVRFDLPADPQAADPNCTPGSAGVAIQAVRFIQCAAEQQLPALLECVTDSSKAPALLSLLLSCLKRLQQQVMHNAAATADVNRTRLDWMSFAVASTQAAAMMISAAAGHSRPVHTTPKATAAGTSATKPSNSKNSNPGSGDSRRGSKGHAADQLSTHAGTEPAVTSSMWLLLAGRALYTTGVAIQATLSLGDRGSSTSATTEGMTGHQQQQQQQQLSPSMLAPLTDCSESLPQLWLPILQDSIMSLGSAVQQLAAPDGTAAVQGSKQLRVVLGRPVLDARTQLEAACAAADSACQWNLADELAAAAGHGGGHGGCGIAGHKQPTSATAAAWQQLRYTGTGKPLADSLLTFGSLLCAALPTRFCCNEPSCCCFDKPSELQLAAGKGSKCSGCGTARYCGAADQRKHWKQHKHACKAVAAASQAGTTGKAKKGPSKDKAAQKQR